MFFAVTLMAQNPHGDNLKIDCASCHSPEGWAISADYWNNREWEKEEGGTKRFDHDQTRFPLKDRHATVDCRTCHETLVFSEANGECISCHTDIHQQTVGVDCARCHSSANWLVDNITEIHQQNGFPLLGQHATANCTDCHQSETALRFDRLGQECINCHRQDYLATTAPNHEAAGYSTECQICHDQAGPSWFWSAGTANHLFFPLTKGHQIEDCTKCHIGGNFSNTPTDCFACHEADYRATTSPDHEAQGFPTDCVVCHGTDVGWPANNFTDHDNQYFPIYSGKHKNKWSECIDCHTTPGNFMVFDCIACHHDAHHQNQGNTGCYECHPKGR